MSEFFACPCCTYPTLTQRGQYEVCTICWWEDAGRAEETPDEENATNHGYTLTRACANVADHLDMYDAGTGIGAVTNPSPERKALLAYIGTLRAGQPFDERKLHSLLRGQSDAMRRSGL